MPDPTPMTVNSKLHGYADTLQFVLEYNRMIALQDKKAEASAKASKQLKEIWAKEAKAFPPITDEERDEFFNGPDLNKFRTGLKKFNCNHYVSDMIDVLFTPISGRIKEEKIKILIKEFGFNINNLDKKNDNRTMLHSLLLDKDLCRGIDILNIIKLTTGLRGNEKLNLNTKDIDGQTLFMLAIAMDYQEIVDFIWAQRSTLNLDVDAQDCNGYTALHYACIFRNIPAITSLMQTALKARVDNAGRTPQQLLEDKHQYELSEVMKQLLLQADRDIKAKTDYLYAIDGSLIVPSCLSYMYLIEGKPIISTLAANSIFAEIKEQESLLSTKRNLAACIDRPKKFVALRFTPDGALDFSPLTAVEIKCLYDLQKQFAGISLKEQILAKNEEAKQLFVKARSSLAPSIPNADALTTVGSFKKAIEAPSIAQKEAPAEQKSPN